MSDAFFQAYAIGFHLVFGLTVGHLGLLLLYLLVGGEWGHLSRPVLRAGASLMPWMVLFYLPLALGFHHLYPWSHADHVHTLSATKAIYFKPALYFLRAAIYLALLSGIAALTRAKMSQAPVARSLLAFMLLATFAAFDWFMSLDPHWFSTIYGGLFIIGGGLSAFAWIVICLRWVAPALGKPPVFTSEKPSHDIGNLMFAFTLLWTYLSLSQFLIIWAANLPEEATWYIARNAGAWRWVSIGLFVCQFLLPFLLLLARDRKRDLTRLAKVAVWVLAIRAVESLWQIKPYFTGHHGFSLHVLDILVPAGLFVIWFFLFRRAFAKELTV